MCVYIRTCMAIIVRTNLSLIPGKCVCVFFVHFRSLKPALVLLGSTESQSVCLTSSIGMTWAYPPPAAPPRHKEEVAQSEADNGTGTHKGGVLCAGL